MRPTVNPEEVFRSAPVNLNINPADLSASINPQIPQFIRDTPWYSKTEELDQNQQKEVKEDLKQSASFNLSTLNPQVCSNCHETGHESKNCLERPNKKAALELKPSFGVKPPKSANIKQSNKSWEEKRDQYTEYDPEEHEIIEKRYEKLDQARANLQKTQSDKTGEEEEQVGQKVDKNARMTIRNLRLREDTVKYLQNLRGSSAYYDPKTRSMREDPFLNEKDKKDNLFRGDNENRYGPEVQNFAKLQNFAWDAKKRGSDLHLQADPTKAELALKEFKNKREVQAKVAQKSLSQLYGDSTEDNVYSL